MREAIGGGLLLNIVIIIIGVISAFLIGSVAYSKAYKAKNRIISVVEKHDGICFDSIDSSDSCYKEIEDELKDLGYSANISATCPNIEIDNTDSGIKSVERVYPSSNYNSGHKYCVYRYTLCDTVDCGSGIACESRSNQLIYYKVIIFMHFDIPVVGSFLEFPISGETKAFYEKFVNIKK